MRVLFERSFVVVVGDEYDAVNETDPFLRRLYLLIVGRLGCDTDAVVLVNLLRGNRT